MLMGPAMEDPKGMAVAVQPVWKFSDLRQNRQAEPIGRVVGSVATYNEKKILYMFTQTVRQSLEG